MRLITLDQMVGRNSTIEDIEAGALSEGESKNSSKMPYNQANMDERDNYFTPNYQNYPVPVTPPGLEAIYSACRKLYTEQPNPLQVTALVKYW